MIDSTGIVIALDGNYAIIRPDDGGCGHCHEEGGCGGSRLTHIFCGRPETFRVSNPKGSLVGDRVTISIPDGAVRRSAFLVYGVPLVFLFSGAFAGQKLAGEAGAILASFLGLLLSWVCARWFILSAKAGQHPEPCIQETTNGIPEHKTDAVSRKMI